MLGEIKMEIINTYLFVFSTAVCFMCIADMWAYTIHRLTINLGE